MTFSADFCILHSFAAGKRKNAPPRSAERHREPNIQRSLVQKGVSAAFLLSQLAAHQHAHDGGHHQAAGPAGRVAEAVQALDVGVEVRVHLDLVGVELVKRIVDSAGGTIKAENREYGGCRFVVELPIQKDEAI